MKKQIYMSLVLIPMWFCNAHAMVYCTNWGEVVQFNASNPQGAIANCTVENVFGDSDCATLDYSWTYMTKFSDGTCRYLESCATCPDGYEKEEVAYKVGELCYFGDEKPFPGFDQDMLDNTINYYYRCTKKPVPCKSGYYGTSYDGTTGCQECPKVTGIYTDKQLTQLAKPASSGIATTKGDCYIPAGTYYDSTGTFTTTGCPY